MNCLKDVRNLLPGIARPFNDGFEEIQDWYSLRNFFDPEEIVNSARCYSTSERILIAAIMARADYGALSSEIWEWGFDGFYELLKDLQAVLVEILSEGEFRPKGY